MKTTTPTYTLQTESKLMSSPRMCWNVKVNGRPTVANIEKWVKGFNASLLGINSHLTKLFGGVEGCTIVRAAVSFNGGETVAEWRA